MGLRISSIDGLVAARGYELCILTFGFSDASPEGRAVHDNFQYMADELGASGMIVTGGYHSEFKGNARGFLEHVAGAIYDSAFRLPENQHGWNLPIPALVVLRRSEEGPPEIGYFDVGGANDSELVSLFRTIVSHSDVPGGISAMQGNALRPNPGFAKSIWEALQLKPTVYGIGADLKPMIEGLVRRQSTGRR